MRNQAVDRFIQDVSEVDHARGKTVASLRELMSRAAPLVEEEIKYGGIVFLCDGELFGGIFVRKSYVTVEFGCGARMKDPEGILEGGGKHRRHLKLYGEADIQARKVEYFVKQIRGLKDNA